ncbi:MAG: hypothetical protein ABIG66_00655 [Candidatus Kerfeldbacteria bacterium]
MKKSLYGGGIAVVLAVVVTSGALCPSQQEETNTNANVNENTNEQATNTNQEPAIAENPFDGAWSWVTSEDSKTITTEVVVNDDGSSDIPDVWVGTADSLTSTVSDGSTTATVPLSGDFGIYRVEGNDITMEAANGSTVFTGAFTNAEQTDASGTWQNTGRGTSGTWTATKGEQEEEMPDDTLPNT